MTKEYHTFLHDITNKLAKIDGYTFMLKVAIGKNDDRIMKIQKATKEAVELVKEYRVLLESKQAR